MPRRTEILTNEDSLREKRHNAQNRHRGDGVEENEYAESLS